MKSFCLLNHELTANQVKELTGEYGASEIVYPDSDLKKAWSQVAACREIDRGLIARVISWLSAAGPGDALVVQGEFGATFMVVDYALKHKLLPLHAVTERIASEERNGEKVSRKYLFEHVCFRKYGYYHE